MKKFFTMITAIALITGMFPANAFGDTVTNVKITMPYFNITLNDQKIANDNRKYPLILCNGITYFPMTYNDSRFLGLTSGWTEENGLKIESYSKAAPYAPEQIATKNDTSYMASVATDKITVNGKSIDNSKEKYPLLNFRYITYFPLTWQFAVDEFKWSYEYTDAKGLVINRTGAPSIPDVPISPETPKDKPSTVAYKQTEEGKVLTTVTVPMITSGASNAVMNGAATISGNYVYFQGLNGAIYQAPVPNPNKKTKIYNLPLNEMSPTNNNYVLAKLSSENGKTILDYHNGSASMGVDTQIWLKNDNSALDISMFAKGYTELFGNMKIGIKRNSPPAGNNLFILNNGETEPLNLGNPDLYYGYGSNTIEAYGKNIYVLADTTYNSNATYIYRVNTKTNETVKLLEEPVKYFQIDGNYIYFVSTAGKLKRMNLTTAKIQLLNISDGILGSVDLQNGYIIYELNNADGSYLETNILSPSGKLALKTTDKILGIQIDKSGNIQYVKN